MRRLTRSEFEGRFPRRDCSESIDGIFHDELHVVHDVTIAGIVKGPLFVHNRAHVVVSGVVAGPITIDRDGVLWCEPGLVEGRIEIEGPGAAFLTATVGRVRGGRDACIFDPCGPADSEAGG